MKLVQITFHFEFSREIEQILDEQEVAHYVRVPMIEGKDDEGKHQGTQVYPGNVTLVQAMVNPDRLDDLLDALEEFRQARQTHEHLEALVLDVERRLGDSAEDGAESASGDETG